MGSFCRLVACALIMSAPTALAQEMSPSERALKAAFILNFARFVDWPEKAFKDEKEAFVLTIAGDDPFKDELSKVFEGQTIRGRPIKVEHVKTIEDIEECHLVFLSESLQDKLPELLKKMGKRPVLTVSDAPDFAKKGGMFQLYLDGKRLRFKINVRAADSNGLKVSAKLLKLGDLVEGPAEGRP